MKNKAYLYLFVILIMAVTLFSACSFSTAADDGHIIYLKRDDHSWWSIEPDGRNPHQVDIPLDVYSVYSNPDRTLVFFQSRDFFVFNPDRGNVRPMELPQSNGGWVWSPNGQEMLGGDIMNRTVVLENFVTGETMEFTPGGNFTDSRFSPDGKWLAYKSEEGIYLVGPDRQDQRLVSDGPTIVGFTPESDQFLYIFRDDDTAVLNIENLDGSNRRELLRAERLGGADVLLDKRVVLVEGTKTVSVQAIDLDTGSQIWASSDSKLRGRRNEGFSPNGKLFILGYNMMEEYPTYHVMDVASGDETCLIDPRPQEFSYDIEFSADGWYASFTNSAGSGFVVNFKTCQLLRLPTPQETADTSDQVQTSLAVYTEWAPKATQLLITVGDPYEEMTLFLYDSNSNDIQELASGLSGNGTFSPNGEKIAMTIVTEGENKTSKSSIYLIDVDSLETTLFLEDAWLDAWVR